jgi:hypothetical protein
MNSALLRNIPMEMRVRPQWVGWKLEERQDKVTKIPVNPNDGRNAATDRPSTWGTFEDAVAAVPKYGLAGIGFVFTEKDPFVGIDLDRCFDPVSAKIEESAKRCVSRFESYTEVSPSGNGLHIIVKGSLPAGGRRKGQIEIYDQGRYFTFTGNAFNGTILRIEDRTEELELFHRELFGGLSASGKLNEGPFLSDLELIKKAMASSNGNKFSELWSGNWQSLGYPSQSEADQALCNLLVFWCGNDPERIDRLFRESGLYREKWDRIDYSKKTIMKAIATVTETYLPKTNDLTTIQPPKGLEGTLVQEAGPKKETRSEISFPYEVMTGLAGAFANLFSSYTEAPAQFYYFAFLTCLGNILADRLTLESQIAPQPRLYTVLLGESADDRKSTAISQTVRFFENHLVKGEINICHGVGSAEGLQKRLETGNKLVLCFDEFKSFVSKCKIEASVLLPCVTTLFESNRYENRTKTTEISLDNVYLSILAASTVPTYENTWSSQFTDIGFVNRLFLVTGRGERRFSIPPKIPITELNYLRYDLQDVLKAAVPELVIEPDASELYQEWYLSIPASVHSRRLDTYSLRLMCLLAANERKAAVDVDTVNKAILLADWQLETRQLYDPIDSDSVVARMEEKIRRTIRARGSVSDRDLKRYVNAHRAGLWVFKQALTNLLGEKELKFDQKTREFF